MTLAYFTPNLITGTRADRFTLSTTNLPAGYRFIETDTLDEYYWNATKWILKTFGTIRKWGSYPASASGTTSGILGTPTAQGSASFQISFTAPAGKAIRFTSAGVSGDNAGLIWSGALHTYRGWYPRFFCRFRIDSVTSQRTWVGLTNHTGAHPSLDTELNAQTGILFGRRTTDTANWVVMYNDGSATALYTTIGGAPDTGVHTVEIVTNDAVPAFYVSLDNAAFVTISGAQLPAQNTGLTPLIEVEDSGGAAKAIDVHILELQSDL